jgi:hypothetical protein
MTDKDKVKEAVELLDTYLDKTVGCWPIARKVLTDYLEGRLGYVASEECKFCNGKGVRTAYPFTGEKCPKCNGTGKVGKREMKG